VLSVVVGLAGCAAARVEGMAQPSPAGGYALRLELDNFAFRPNVVTVPVSTLITVTAVNGSRIKHNVTVLWEGEVLKQVLKSVDVPAGETVSFDLALPVPARYAFYCDVFLHRPLGMKGVLVAETLPR
jgi:plastocyanin